MGFFDAFASFGDEMDGGGGSPFGILDYYRKNLQAQQAQQQLANDTMAYNSLLGKYGVNKDFKGEVPPAFFLEAASIPSLRAGLLTGGQVQAGAMARTIYGNENISAEAKARMEAEAVQNAARMAEQKRVNDAAIAADVARTENLRKQTGLLGLDKTGAATTPNGGGLLGLPTPEKGYAWDPTGQRQTLIPGSGQQREAEMRAGQLARALSAADRLDAFYGSEGTFGGGEAGGAAASDFLEIVAARAKKAEAGAMSDSEIEFYSGGLANPLAKGSLLKRTATTRGALKSIKSEMETEMLDYLEANPEVVRNNPQLFNLVKGKYEARQKARGLLGPK